MTINFIDDVDSSRDDWNILVRIARKWDVYNMQNEDDQFYIEMILIDEKGVALHAVIRKNLIAKPIKGTKKALFLLTTNATEVKDTTANIPLHYFEIATLQEIEERIADRTILTDIIGKLVAISKLENKHANGRTNKIRRLEILLKENITMKITLWRKAALLIDETTLGNGTNTVVIIVTSTLVNKFRDELSLNSTTNTKIYINLPTHETADISKRYENDKREVRELPSQEISLADIERRMFNNRLTLQQIMDIKWQSPEQNKIYTVIASIDQIDDKNGWCYIACEVCMRKLKEDGDNFTCNICRRSSKYPTPRFRIELQVSDSSATGYFTLFDREAHTLISTTAAELLSLHNGDTKNLPPILLNLCNRKLIFEIQLNEKNLKEGWQTYTITKTFLPNASLEKLNNHTDSNKKKGNNKPQNEITENCNQMDKDNNIENLQILILIFSISSWVSSKPSSLASLVVGTP
ncbi:hypothetical protein ACFE04_013520 [Oxalis oulophora]